jgi:hypothetical protein
MMTPLAHAPPGLAAAEERAAEVHVLDEIPLLVGGIGEDRRRENARIVDPDVDGAELLVGRFGEARHRRCIGDVERVSVHRRVELAGERGGGLGSAARVLVTEQQVSPCFPEAPSDRLAEASGSAGDDGGPPFQGDQLGDAAGCEDMRV